MLQLLLQLPPFPICFDEVLRKSLVRGGGGPLKVYSCADVGVSPTASGRRMSTAFPQPYQGIRQLTLIQYPAFTPLRLVARALCLGKTS